jgi:signal transduction histidine kinase
MAEQIIKGLSRKLFRSLITLNLALTLGMLLFAAFSMQLSSVVFTGIFFLLALVTYVAGEWHDEWTLKNTKITTYLLVTAVLILKLFASSDSLLVFIIIDIILVEVLFNRYVAVLREQQNRFPLYLITVALFVVFIDEATNFVHPNIFNASVTMEVLIFGFVIVKLLFTSAMLFVESKRSATQRLKEEQFIDYSADFNNSFSHYINTPLTTVMSNIEIVRFKLGKRQILRF